MSKKEEVIARIMSAKREFKCSGCGQKFTVLVSLNCNCGGAIGRIIEDEQKA